MRRRLLALRPPALWLPVLVALWLAPPSAAVTIDWVAVGNPGNASSASCYSVNCGSVSNDYYISKYETTNTQYAEFLNAKAATDPLGLYSTSMGSDASYGGITRSGVSGSYTYTAKVGFEAKPVLYVSFYDALRFANWLNNGQGSGDTETGAYTITPTGITNNTIVRNPGALTFLTSENEWFKAAFYSPGGTYFLYPTGTNSTPGCVLPTSDTGNSANCSPATGNLPTNVGAYSLSDSPYGTFDQGGNAYEWNESIVSGTSRGVRGGSWFLDASFTARTAPGLGNPTAEYSYVGFRVASLVPEPGTALLLGAGLAALAARRRRG